MKFRHKIEHSRRWQWSKPRWQMDTGRTRKSSNFA